MNTYDARTRLILSEIGRVTLGLLATNTVNKSNIAGKLHRDAETESNPARKGILNDAVAFLNRGA